MSGFLQVVEFVGLRMNWPAGKRRLARWSEEHLVGDQARHGDHAPARQAGQLGVDPREVGDAGAVQVERLEPLQERIAGAALEQGGLALVEGDPDLVLGRRIALPALVDGPVGPRARGRALGKAVGAHASKNGRFAGKFRSEIGAADGRRGRIIQGRRGSAHKTPTGGRGPPRNCHRTTFQTKPRRERVRLRRFKVLGRVWPPRRRSARASPRPSRRPWGWPPIRRSCAGTRRSATDNCRTACATPCNATGRPGARCRCAWRSRSAAMTRPTRSAGPRT